MSEREQCGTYTSGCKSKYETEIFECLKLLSHFFSFLSVDHKHVLKEISKTVLLIFSVINRHTLR